MPEEEKEEEDNRCWPAGYRERLKRKIDRQC
jgi:hypothetical protein